MTDYAEYTPFVMRVLLGLLFLIPGYGKLMSLINTGDHMVSSMLWGIVALAWVLAIVEVVGGAMLLVGYKVQYPAWALAAVLVGAIVLAVYPGRADNALWQITLMLHLVAITALVNIGLTGNVGPYGIDK